MAHLIICPNCGAPLPKQASQAAFAVCGYCRVTANVESRIVTQRAEAITEDDDYEDEWTRRSSAKKEFEAALRAEGERGQVSYPRLRELCAEHLDVWGQTDAVAIVAYNLALDFEKESGSAVRTSGEALARLSLAYFGAVEELRSKDESVVNLPFFIVTDEGPKHFTRTLDVPTLISLTERDPLPPQQVAPIAQSTVSATRNSAAEQPEPKRGFWSKLFG